MREIQKKGATKKDQQCRKRNVDAGTDMRDLFFAINQARDQHKSQCRDNDNRDSGHDKNHSRDVSHGLRRQMLRVAPHCSCRNHDKQIEPLDKKAKRHNCNSGAYPSQKRSFIGRMVGKVFDHRFAIANYFYSLQTGRCVIPSRGRASGRLRRMVTRRALIGELTLNYRLC